ncbi:DUF421 domain-containing protein [Alicyclobacillus sp. SO9]|uniref:DUF421 domain-containing protein n=1 Tax=Alicyclobacillus sp. SO9 TaxID=2665646 RepID=UPI0018E81F90|nr:YetF domain-containing protein [Alicyclobacillus sp. SO9]QQE76816.1 DUF421 domain-containing protein [Alicyclobacillus sp. SO9]
MNIHWLLIAAFTVLTFLVLLAFVRWIGSTQLSQVTFFNWVAGACMGNIGANMISAHNTKGWTENFFALLVFTLATIVAAWISLKNRGLRRLANGEPVILVHKGILLRENLKKTKVNIDVLMMLLRQKGYFAYQDIEYAILEPTGSLSILPVQEAQSVSKKDLKDGPDLSEDKGGPFAEIVIDGTIDEDKLYKTGHDKIWLQRQILDSGAAGLSEITYLAVNKQGHVIVDANRLKNNTADKNEPF